MDLSTSIPYLKNLLHNPTMVSLQCLLVGFRDIDTDVVGIVLIPLAICQTLQQDLNEAQAPEEHSKGLNIRESPRRRSKHF